MSMQSVILAAEVGGTFTDIEDRAHRYEKGAQRKHADGHGEGNHRKPQQHLSEIVGLPRVFPKPAAKRPALPILLRAAVAAQLSVGGKYVRLKPAAGIYKTGGGKMRRAAKNASWMRKYTSGSLVLIESFRYTKNRAAARAMRNQAA